MLFGITRVASCICLTLVLANHYVQAAVPTGELVSATRAAKGQFRPLAESNVTEARQQLLAAADRLEARLKVGGPNAAEWRGFVELPVMRSQLAPGHTPDLAKLKEIYGRYASGYSGLGLSAFRDVGQSLYEFVFLASYRAMNDKALRAEYEKVLDSLAAGLEAYAKTPTSDTAQRINMSLTWLSNARQAPELRQQIVAAFHQPNVLIHVSNALANAGASRTIDQVEPIDDCILGTSIHGTGHVAGQVTTQLAADDERAVIDAVFLGGVSSNSIGFNRGVQINTTGYTSIGAIKRTWVTAEGFWSLPACSNAETCTNITGICASHKMVERIAWKRADEQKCEAEAIASEHAQERMNTRMDEQTVEQLNKANEQYYENFRGPLSERGLFPEDLHFSSTDQQLSVAAVEAKPLQIAASAAPALLPDAKADMSALVHETMINNFAQNSLGGMILHEEEVRAVSKRILGKEPPELKPDEDREPWGIAFAQQQPITVHLGDNTLDITVRGQRYFQGDSPRPGMNVTAHYKLVGTGPAVKAVRQGDLEIVPPDGNRPLSGKETATKRAIQRRFDKIFHKEFIPESIVPTGNWAKVGKLVPIQLSFHDGWLAVGWKAAAIAATVP